MTPKPAITVGVVEFVIFACYAIIFTFLWRTASVKLADRPVGVAMTAVYS